MYDARKEKEMKFKVMMTAAGAAAVLAGCGTLPYNAPPPSPGDSLSGCGDIQMLDLPAVAQAVDAANDFGATPPNGATQLTKAQLANIKADGKLLLAFKGGNPQDPQFEDQVGKLGLLLVQIANPIQDGYVDNNQAPAVDRSERFLQGACGFSS